MTTDRLVKLERMAMHRKRLASISDNSVLNAFISSGPRKLDYRRLEGFKKKFIFNKISFFYFQPSYGKLLFLTQKTYKLG